MSTRWCWAGGSEAGVVELLDFLFGLGEPDTGVLFAVELDRLDFPGGVDG